MTDLALQWMSFRRSGKTADLGTDLTGGAGGRRLVDDLVILGHAERTGADGWRIAPPVLAGLPRDAGAAAVLCGARTTALLESLDRASAAAVAQMSSVQRGTVSATITVTAPSPDVLAQVAEAAGMPFQAEAGLHMLACTPSIREWPRTPFPMVEGKVDSVSRFSRSRMRWVTSTLAEATAAAKGFFRIKRDWDWVSLLKSGPTSASLIDDRAGRLAAAAKCRAVRWSRESGVLTLPAQLYPPTLMARGLVLCSGHLPEFQSGRKANQLYRRPAATPEAYPRPHGTKAAMNNPIDTFNSLKNTYLRYFDSPFDLRFEDLVQARLRLLDRDGVLYREPLIEPQPGYVLSGHDIRAATSAALTGAGGWSPQVIAQNHRKCTAVFLQDAQSFSSKVHTHFHESAHSGSGSADAREG